MTSVRRSVLISDGGLVRRLLLLTIPLLAACAAVETNEASSIDGFALFMGLFGGLALFLFGIDQMSDGLKAVAGERMSSLLGGLTKNRFLGAITGMIVTAVLNSSSVTTVLVVGFITAGIMTLQQSIGVIMGANIGSTMTAQIVAFNVTQYAMLPIAVGFMMIFFSKADRMKHAGSMLFGLGLLFGGMGVMSDAMYPLRSFQPFLDLMAKMDAPALAILTGAVFTGLVQSSAATTGIAIVMASEGLMSLPAGIGLALGANIGTCMTAVLAAIGKPVAARRAAAAHILFNVMGVLIWVPLMGVLTDLATSVSPSYPDLSGTERMAQEVPRQIANAHTIFNVANTILFIWFTGLFARLVVRLVPERPEVIKEIIRPKYLEEALLSTPALAMRAVRFEIVHMGEIAVDLVRKLGPAVQSRQLAEIDALEKMDDQLDVLHEKITDYLSELRKGELSNEETDGFLRLMRGVDEIERIGDVVESDIIPLARNMIDQDLKTTDTTRHVLTKLYDRVCTSVEYAVQAIGDLDENKALDVVNMKAEINSLIEEALQYQADRVAPKDNIAIFRMEDEFIDAMGRVYSLSKRLARLLLPASIASKDI